MPRQHAHRQRQGELRRDGLLPQVIRCIRLPCVQYRVRQLSKRTNAGMYVCMYARFVYIHVRLEGGHLLSFTCDTRVPKRDRVIR